MTEQLTPRQLSQRARRDRERAERDAPNTEALVSEIQAGTATPPAASPEGQDLSQQPVVARPEVATVADEGDDVSGLVYSEIRDRELNRMLTEINEAQASTPQQQAPAAPAAAPKAEEQDRWGIRLIDMASWVLPFPIKFLPQSTREAMIGGQRDAVVNTAKALDSFAEWANQNIMDLGGEGVMTAAAEKLPEVPESEDVANSLVRGVTQFLTGFIPGLQAVRAAQGARAVGTMTSFLQAELVGGGAAALVFDPFDENLSNLLESVPSLSNPVTRYLMVDEDDSEAHARLKTAIEGAGLGAAAEGVFRGLRAAKRYWVEAEASPTMATLDEGVNLTPDLGDPDAPLFVRSSRDADADTGALSVVDLEEWINNPARNTDAPFEVNWTKINSEADIDELIDQVATAMRGTIDEARRGTISDDQLRGLAEALNMTPDQLINRRLGQAFNAEQVVASRAILEASARKLIQMGQQYANSTDPVEMFQLMRMLNTHTAVQAQFRGAAAEAGRALRAYQIPHGSPERRILEIQNQLMANGGPCS